MARRSPTRSPRRRGPTPPRPRSAAHTDQSRAEQSQAEQAQADGTSPGLRPREALGTWLEGPPRRRDGYPGQRLGLPEEGPASAAGFGERLIALVIDFVLAGVLAVLFLQRSPDQTTNLVSDGIFVALTALFLAASGRTPGDRVMRLQVVRLDGSTMGWRSFPRQVLVALLIPAVIWDRDRRGLHDRAVGTIVVHR